MFGEVFIFMILLLVVLFQCYRIIKVKVFMKKDFIFYSLMLIGSVIILGITIVFGKGLFHYIIGLLGTISCVISVYVYGLTSDGITCYQPGGGSGASLVTFIGRNFKYKKITRIELQNKQNSIILKFIYYGSEKKMKFSESDRSKIEEILKSKGFIV